MSARWASDPGGPESFSKLDDALDRGYNPDPSDLLPPPAHLALADDDDWMVALAASVAEVARWTS